MSSGFMSTGTKGVKTPIADPVVSRVKRDKPSPVVGASVHSRLTQPYFYDYCPRSFKFCTQNRQCYYHVVMSWKDLCAFRVYNCSRNYEKSDDVVLYITCKMLISIKAIIHVINVTKR